MTRKCKECGQEIKFPRMNEEEYRNLLNEIGGARGEKNRIVAWILGVERKEGLTEAILTLEDYMAGGFGVGG